MRDLGEPSFPELGRNSIFIEVMVIVLLIIHCVHPVSIAVAKVVACALVTQRARVRSPIWTGFLDGVFSGFFLTCKTNVRKL